MILYPDGSNLILFFLHLCKMHKIERNTQLNDDDYDDDDDDSGCRGNAI